MEQIQDAKRSKAKVMEALFDSDRPRALMDEKATLNT